MRKGDSPNFAKKGYQSPVKNWQFMTTPPRWDDPGGEVIPCGVFNYQDWAFEFDSMYSLDTLVLRVSAGKKLANILQKKTKK